RLPGRAARARRGRDRAGAPMTARVDRFWGPVQCSGASRPARFRCPQTPSATTSASALGLLALVLVGTPVAAHDRTTSYSTWEMRGREARVTVRLADLDVAPSHLHFARVTRDGESGPERVLSAGERVWRLDDAGALGSSVASYVVLGIEHIATGYDHLAFLAALLLIAGSLGEVARIVTGFTAAHSLTLALAVLGWVRPERAPIEALIGLSIALVATENVWLAGARGRVLPAVVAG